MKNTARLVDSHSKTRGAEHNRCSLCDDGYGKWTYQYAKVVSGPAKGAVICPDCLKARNFSERAEVSAQEHEASMRHHKECARLLREQVEWDVPTFEEWDKREKKADAQYCVDADYVIGCPACGGIDEIARLPMVDIGVCEEHKLAWCVEDRVQVIPDGKVFGSSVEGFLKKNDHLVWMKFSERQAKVIEEWNSKPF